MMKKLLLAYFSATGATKTVVEALAKGFGANEISKLDFTSPDFRAQEDILVDEDTTVVFAGPVFAGRIQTDAMDQLKRIKGNGNAICICVYGNRDFDDALIELYDTAIDNGFNVVGNGAFIGEHSFTHITDFNIAKNRPDANDLTIAENFGRDIVKKIVDGNLSNIEPKGNRPYKDGMSSLLVAPDTLDTCIKCGKCITVCPVNAINTEFKCNPDLCILCGACGKVCPVNAKVCTVEPLIQKSKLLSTLEKRVPKLFI